MFHYFFHTCAHSPFYGLNWQLAPPQPDKTWPFPLVNDLHIYLRVSKDRLHYNNPLQNTERELQKKPLLKHIYSNLLNTIWLYTKCTFKIYSIFTWLCRDMKFLFECWKIYFMISTTSQKVKEMFLNIIWPFSKKIQTFPNLKITKVFQRRSQDVLIIHQQI